LGYRQQTSLRDGIAQTVDWMRTRSEVPTRM
jgi:nucleoside-diphosphate-sugar epimerase